MKMLDRLLLLSMLITWSCAAEKTQLVKKAQSDNQSPTIGDKSGKGRTTSLTLSWKPVSSITSYHIYYVNPQKKVLEIDSVSQTEDKAGFEGGTLKIDQNNMEAWPKAGEEACFYVVANLEGVKSDPSKQACIEL